MEIYSSNKKMVVTWMLLTTFAWFTGAAHGQGDTTRPDLVNTFDLKIEIDQSGHVYGPAELTVLPGIPARLTLSGEQSEDSSYQIRLLTNAVPSSKSGESIVQVNMMALAKTEHGWTIIGEPLMRIETGQRALTTVFDDENTLEISIEPKNGPQVKITDESLIAAMQGCNQSVDADIAQLWGSAPGTRSQNSCCSASCQDGTGRTLNCCGAVSCCACGACCETGGGGIQIP